MDDKRILALFHQRSEQAIIETAKQYGMLLQRIAVNILADRRDAQECVNDTYLALWQRIPPERPEPLRPYICRVVRNLSLARRRDDRAQKRNSEYDLSLDELADCMAAPGLEETLEARELGRAIDAFLDTVSKENRIIFLRRHWFGDSIKDIASLLDFSESAVSVRLHRTRNQLKTYLIREGYYEG